MIEPAAQTNDSVSDECMTALLQQRVCSHCNSPHHDTMMPLQCGLHRMCLVCVKSTLQQQFYHMHKHEVFENLYRIECAQCQTMKYVTMPLREQLLDSQAHIRLSQDVLKLVPAGAHRYARGSHKCRICQLACVSDKLLREHSVRCVSRTLCPHPECSQLVVMSHSQHPHACNSHHCERCSIATNLTAGELQQHQTRCDLFDLRLTRLRNDANTLSSNVHAQHCSPLQMMQTIAALNTACKQLEDAMSCPPSRAEP